VAQTGNNKGLDMRILMVCLGNICRSPIAQAVLEARARAAGVAVTVDSAGTGGWHTGDPPDHRAADAAARHGLDITGQTARSVTAEDFERFDLICAMDERNETDLHAMAPPGASARIVRLLDFAGPDAPRSVPDPFYGSTGGFENAVALIERGVDGLIAELRQSSSAG
jgi:protein-tyrosine phosphatase